MLPLTGIERGWKNFCREERTHTTYILRRRRRIPDICLLLVGHLEQTYDGVMAA